MNLFGISQRIFCEALSGNMSLEDLKERLEHSGEKLSGRLQNAADTPTNLRAAKHVIGIERWGQSRLRTALGTALVRDEYDSYRPDDLKDMAALAEAFRETRRTTLEIIEALQKAGVSPNKTAFHNEMGEITIRAWLYYLDNHANRETWLIREPKPVQAH